MNRELRIGLHIRQPVTFAAGLTGYVVVPVNVMEVDLDANGISGFRPEGRYINNRATVEGTFDCCIHNATNRAEQRSIPSER